MHPRPGGGYPGGRMGQAWDGSIGRKPTGTPGPLASRTGPERGLELRERRAEQFPGAPEALPKAWEEGLKSGEARLSPRDDRPRVTETLPTLREPGPSLRETPPGLREALQTLGCPPAAVRGIAIAPPLPSGEWLVSLRMGIINEVAREF
jgi:hypothetical protein